MTSWNVTGAEDPTVDHFMSSFHDITTSIDQETKPILDQRKSSQAYIEDAASQHRNVYVGMHLRGGYNDKGPQKHGKHRKKRERSVKGSAKIKKAEEEVLPPQQQVQFLLGGEGDVDRGTTDPPDYGSWNCSRPRLFTEMDELCVCEDGETYWKETARWIKFEECVEEGGDRWSKPHVATLSLHSLFELRSCVLNGVVQLDMDAQFLEQITDITLDLMVSQGQLPHDDELREKLKDALLSGHEHQTERNGGLNPIKSVADLMSTKRESSAGFAGMRSNSSAPNLNRKMTSTSLSPVSEELPTGLHEHEKKDKKLPYFMKKIPTGAEACNVLIGEADFLEQPVIAFVRLRESVRLEGLTEVPIPTRFIFIMLGPTKKPRQYHEIGRSIATLMADEVFHEVAYKARTRQDLLAGIDEFMDQVTVLPPGEWDSKIRIEPPQDLPKNQMQRLQSKGEDMMGNGSQKQEICHVVGPELQRTGRLFGGLISDVKRKAPFFLSDFKDALSIQCVASFIFLYFAVLTPIVTFGGLLGDATHNYISAIESIFGAAMAGTTFHLFSGQPLTIIGSTGPILVFETIMFEICTSAGIDYLSIRWWVGVWTGLLCIALVATDASSLIQYITRYTEESFSALISLIFIYEAFKKLVHVSDELKVWHGWNGDHITYYGCECSAPNLTSYNITGDLNFTQMSIDSKELALKSHGSHHEGTLYRSGNVSYTCSFDGRNYNVSDIDDIDWISTNKTSCLADFCGDLEGDSCAYTPDAMLMSVILFFGTFAISTFLKGLKMSRFFPTKVRSIISDFAVTIAIAIMVVFDILMKLDTPKLQVPDTFRPTRLDRTWFVDPLGKNEWWTIPLALAPALLCTILIFMDQQITAVIVNRKENKLRKGCGYHLDLLVVSIMLMVCSIMGLPWFVAATVLSITHVNSLKMESETSAPGEAPKFLGVREQRVTGIMIFLLIGLSVLMTPVLKFIPMPVLYGVFLYMGVSSLKGVQFIDRLLLFFMPPKHQPDFIYLRHVPLPKVHLFTFFQLLGLVLLWVIKSIKPVSIIFPMMVAALVGVRKSFDFCIFTQQDLMWLDDIMPESTKKKKEDAKKKKQEANGANLIPMSGQGTVNVPLQDGKVLKIPVSEIQYNPSDPSGINISQEMARTAIWKTIVHNELGGSGGDLKEREKKVRRHHHKRTKPGIVEGNEYSFPPKTTEEDKLQVMVTPPPPGLEVIDETGKASSSSDLDGLKMMPIKAERKQTEPTIQDDSL